MRALLFIGLAGCGAAPWCNISREAAQIAGDGATDCTDDWGCVADGLASGTPFFMGEWLDYGFDSVSRRALAFDGTHTYALGQERGYPRITAYECVSPSVGQDTGGQPELACESILPENNDYHVCGPADRGVPASLPFPE